MRRNVVFVVFLFIMVGIIIFCCLFNGQIVGKVKTSKEYIDNYVKTNVGENFTYISDKKTDDGYYFYYMTKDNPDFTLVVSVKRVNRDYEITNNYSEKNNEDRINGQNGIQNEFKKILGEDKIITICNLAELNLFENAEETLSYNNFELNIGIKQNENILAEIEKMKDVFVKKEINCNVYFYYLSEEQYDKYKQSGMYSVDFGFENYLMMIIENGKIITEIKYE